MSRNLFTYGTLMFPQVWERIGIGDFTSTPATLPGFAIYRVRDAVFPGIVRASTKDCVKGVMYLGLDEETLFEIDTYESGLYEREEVTATLANGEVVQCSAYVIPNSRCQALTDEPWDSARFEKEELEKYLNG